MLPEIYARVRNRQEYVSHLSSHAHIYERIRRLEADLAGRGKEFTVRGFSFPAQMEVDFHVDHLYSGNVSINWRERVICPITHLNNRLRAVVHFMDIEMKPSQDSKIYIAEQLTPLYSYLKSLFPAIIGSEYLGPDILPGAVNQRGIRHEDATALSFKDNELDYYLSFECFEHIPDYMKAFSESYRVLRPGGMMLWTVPFKDAAHDNIIRAVVAADGTLNHILEPEYHGDPVNPQGGVLCYTHFGWQMFSQLRQLGFSDAYAITYWSDALGYYDAGQFLFCAVK